MTVYVNNWISNNIRSTNDYLKKKKIDELIYINCCHLYLFSISVKVVIAKFTPDIFEMFKNST